MTFAAVVSGSRTIRIQKAECQKTFRMCHFSEQCPEDGEEITKVLPVLPESDQWWLKIPILVLGLDQGSIGACWHGLRYV